jgi:hypothetical protein
VARLIQLFGDIDAESLLREHGRPMARAYRPRANVSGEASADGIRAGSSR